MFKYLWSLIERYNSKPSPTGLLKDSRPSNEKNRDYLHEDTELGISLGVEPLFSNKKIEQPPFVYLNQLYTSSCVPHAVSLALAHEIYKKTGAFPKLSPLYMYRQRINYPQEGSWLQGMFDIGRKGTCLYDSLPNLTSEYEANNVTLTEAMKNEATILDGLEYYQLSTKFNSIDELALISATNRMIPILIYATIDEWSREYPEIRYPNLDPQKAYVRHCVAVLPNSGFTENGKEYLTVQDSAMFGGIKIRHLSRDFIQARCFGAGYWKSVDIKIGEGTKPVHTFVVPMKKGSLGMDVHMLQKCLIYLGMLPTDCATGYFGARTLAAVRIFQDAHREEILTANGLKEPTGQVYSATMKKLNSIFSS